jgi:hypothetical protein
MVPDYKEPVAAVVHIAAAGRTRAVRPEEVLSSRLAAVVHIVVVVQTVAAAVHTAEVVQVTGIHHREDRETGRPVACRVGVVLGTESSVVAELAQRMRRRQPDVLREAYRDRVKLRSWSQ